MTAFLASVRSLVEAETALAAGADIIDLKEPNKGAMGAVEAGTAAAIRTMVDGRVELSATAGDPGQGLTALNRAVEALAAAGIDTIKVPVPAQAPADFARLIAAKTQQGINIVAVLICDERILLDRIEALIECGASGLMLDTLDKAGPSLVARHDLAVIREFVERVHAYSRLAGLAGGLDVSDITGLLSLGPDLLGFRGALCEKDRVGAVNIAASLRVRAAIPKMEHTWQLRGGRHHGLETRA
jgi:dihydroneopterin aldolase